MKNDTPKVSPVFQGLASFMAVACALGSLVAIAVIISDPHKFSSYGFLFGQVYMCLVFSFAAIRGTVPNWLLNQK